MDERHIMPRGPARQRSWRVSVDAKRKLWFVFCAIDQRIGRRIDDQVGFKAIKRAAKRTEIREIELGAGWRQHLVSAA
jgi:hypothetical protein